ncbi:MAG: hypothetical protein AAFP97_01690 [Pseudomonadota bacterium]
MMLRIVIYFVASTLAHNVSAAGEPAAALDASNSEITEQCFNAPSRIVSYRDTRILCILGRISHIDTDWHIETIDEVDAIFIDSLGGVVDSAIAIGLKIYDSGKPLHVGVMCFSSCANYIVPAARKIVLSKRTIIAFHGTASSASHSEEVIIPPVQYSDRVSPWERDVLRRLNVIPGAMPYEHYNNLEAAYFDEIKVDYKYLSEVNILFERAKSNSEEFSSCRVRPGVAFINTQSRLKQFLVGSVIEGEMAPNDLFIKAQLPHYDISLDGKPCIG